MSRVSLPSICHSSIRSRRMIGGRGRGFTEWTNVAKARPLYHGHVQPRLPADLGFYDLRVAETRQAQANMARGCGVEGFTYWHYWFGHGRRILERPFEEVLATGQPDFPFSLAWANQSWTGIWHGSPKTVLIEQTYPGRADERAHFEWARRAFEDRRYQRVDGKPVFVVFAPHDMPSTRDFIEHWRELADKAGYPGMYFVAISNRFRNEVDRWDNPVIEPFDAVTPLTPHDFLERPQRSLSVKIKQRLRARDFGQKVNRLLGNKAQLPRRFDYADVVASALADMPDAERFLPGVLPGWDNTPRSGSRGVVFEGTTPELFEQYLRKAVTLVRNRPLQRRIVFLKAWNEWAEGNYVEPDALHGHAFLEAISRVMRPAAGERSHTMAVESSSMRQNAVTRNFMLNVAGTILPLGTALLTVPIYIHHIGAARYGILSIVWVLLGYFGFFDFGLSRASANALSRLGHAGASERSPVLVTAFYLNAALGTVGAAFIYLFAMGVLGYLGKVPSELQGEIGSAMPWVAAMLPVALVSAIGAGAIESREKFFVSNIFQTFGGVLGQLLPVIAAITIGPSLAIVLPAAFFARLIPTIAVWCFIVRTEAPVDFRRPERRLVRNLLGYGAWVSVSSALSPLLETADQLLIAAVFGPTSVAHYAVPMSFATRSQLLALALAKTLFPRLSRLDAEEARHLASRSLVTLAYAFGAMCGPGIILAAPLLRAWVGDDFAHYAIPVAQLLLIGAWTNGLGFIPYSLMQAQGRPDITAKIHAAEVVPFLALLYGMMTWLGLPGAALAWTTRTTLDSLIMLWFGRCWVGGSHARSARGRSGDSELDPGRRLAEPASDPLHLGLRHRVCLRPCWLSCVFGTPGRAPPYGWPVAAGHGPCAAAGGLSSGHPIRSDLRCNGHSRRQPRRSGSL